MSCVGGRIGETVSDLPNLKIKIDNDLDPRMETDEDGSSADKGQSSSEAEEGELIDDDDDDIVEIKRLKTTTLVAPTQSVPTGRSILKYDTKEYLDGQSQQEQANVRSVMNPRGAFVTGVDIFSPEEQAKLNKRAQRFGIEASETKVLSEKLLKKLYKSMCVKPTDKNVRTEALHMRGIDTLATQDIFDYFKDYGPASLEWITDNSCNVVWLDNVSAARALLGLSVHISGQPVPPAVPTPATETPDSDVEMESQAVRTTENDEVDADLENLSEESDAVPLDELDVELPEGRWRRGAPHPLTPLILLRFATTQDRSLPHPGRNKGGNHQFGGYVGLISESRKRRLAGSMPNPLLFDDVGDEILPKPAMDEKDNANPWGILAKTWGRFDKVRQPRPPSPKIERILPLPTRMTPPPSPPRFSGGQPYVPSVYGHGRPQLVARTRLRREREVVDPGSSDDDQWRKRSKVPRMRMHADDEEKKLEKRIKRPRHIDRTHSESPDLRRKLKVQRSLRHSDAESSEESLSELEGRNPSPVPALQSKREEQVIPEDDEMPDLRVAVPTETSATPEDSKAGIRQSLFQSGNVKSVLRGARGHSDCDEDDEGEESSPSDKERSARRHRSRSKERRRHHRKHKKEYHKSRRREEDTDSDEKSGKMKSTIRRKSPDVPRDKSCEREEKEKKSPRRERERRRDKREDEQKEKRSETTSRNDSRRHNESRTKKDLRSKLATKHKVYDSYNEYRSKSPLQIEIDNDEYFRQADSD